MKKEDEQFIKEKLDLVLSDVDVSVPDSLRAEYATLASGLQPKKKKRTWVLPTFIPIAAALIVVIVLCSVFLPKKETPHYDYELEEIKISVEELPQYNFLLPNLPYDHAVLSIDRDINYNINVSASLQFTFEDNYLRIDIIMVDDYIPDNIDRYDNLPENGTTELFAYNYHIYNGRQSLAKFEYEGYTYYITYTSETPEDLPLLLQSFSEQA